MLTELFAEKLKKVSAAADHYVLRYRLVFLREIPRNTTEIPCEVNFKPSRGNSAETGIAALAENETHAKCMFVGFGFLLECLNGRERNKLPEFLNRLRF